MLRVENIQKLLLLWAARALQWKDTNKRGKYSENILCSYGLHRCCSERIPRVEIFCNIIYSYGLHACYSEGIKERFSQVRWAKSGKYRTTVKAYQDGKYYIREKLMQKLFEIFKVLQFQKRLYKEIQYSIGLHACYSEGIPYIFLPSS